MAWFSKKDNLSEIREMATAIDGIASGIFSKAENCEDIKKEVMKIREAASKIATSAMKWKEVERIKLEKAASQKK